MKKSFLIFLVSLLVTQLVSTQTIELPKTKSAQELHDNYIEKYKTYKTTGRVLLGSGIGMIVGGGIVFAAYAKQGFNGPAPVSAENLFIIIGPSAALASIPFFILAKRNKTKAELVIKGETVTFGNKIPYKSNYIALAVTIQL